MRPIVESKIRRKYLRKTKHYLSVCNSEVTPVCSMLSFGTKGGNFGCQCLKEGAWEFNATFTGMLGLCSSLIMSNGGFDLDYSFNMLKPGGKRGDLE